MAGKPGLKSELVEELMEGKAILSRFAKDIEAIIQDIDKNEGIDHQDDKKRCEAMALLLDALEAHALKDYEGMQKFLHAGVQRLHEQEMLDFSGDVPRTDAKLKLSLARLNAIHCEEHLTKLTEKVEGIKAL